ncbi:unnamed protein product, partial [Urochloa humidicola]
LTEFQAIALSHIGRATSDIRYNPEAGPEAYSNPLFYSRISTYTELGKAKYGPDWDPAANPLDGEIVMRMGGKGHGRYAIGDSTLDTASTPTLSQIRARSANPDIRPRQTATYFGMQALQAQLEEERKRREDLEARLAAEQQRAEEERRRAEAERLRQEEAERLRQQQMMDWYNWMNGMAQRMGQSPPPAPPPMLQFGTP